MKRAIGCITLTLFAALASAYGLSQSVRAEEAMNPSPTSTVSAVSTNQNQGPKVEYIADEKDKPARTVYFSLEKVKEAQGYDVQIRPYRQRWATPYKFRINSEELRVRLTPDRYSVRTRSFAKKGKHGRWSHWKSFWIRFKPPETVYPAAGSKIDPAGTDIEKVTFEWPKVAGAKAYLFRLRDSSGKVIRIVRTTRTWMPTPLAIMAKYDWCLLPLSNIHEEETPDQCKYNDFTITAPSAESQTVHLDVERYREAKYYEFELVKFKTEFKTGEPATFESHEPQFVSRLAPGEYELRARVVYDDHFRTDWSSPSRFFVKMPPPKRTSPVDGAHFEAVDDEANPVSLQWDPVPGASRYEVFVFDRQGKLFKQMNVQENNCFVEVPEGGEYKWHVVAYSAREPSRSLASTAAEVNNTSTFSTGDYKRLALSSAEEPSQLYGWLKYISAFSSYDLQNYDTDAHVQQSVLTGTGELAAGYWHRQSQFGLLAQGSISGYRSGAVSSNFVNGGLHLGYRQVFEDDARLRVWLGAAYRQLPVIQATPENPTDLSVSTVKNLGPQLQLSYTRSLFSVGWQLSGSMFYGLKDMGTPNGLPQQAQLSYQGSLMAVIPIKPGIVGLAGYTYKHDQAAYLSTDSSGKSNTVDYIGHYLSIGVEFGFLPPKK